MALVFLARRSANDFQNIWDEIGADRGFGSKCENKRNILLSSFLEYLEPNLFSKDGERRMAEAKSCFVFVFFRFNQVFFCLFFWFNFFSISDWSNKDNNESTMRWLWWSGIPEISERAWPTVNFPTAAPPKRKISFMRTKKKAAVLPRPFFSKIFLFKNKGNRIKKGLQIESGYKFARAGSEDCLQGLHNLYWFGSIRKYWSKNCSYRPHFGTD